MGCQLSVYQPASLRLALGLGDQELEQRLRPAFDAADDVVVVAQCLAADQLVQAVESHQVDATVVAWRTPSWSTWIGPDCRSCCWHLTRTVSAGMVAADRSWLLAPTTPAFCRR